jgi:uncharacterized protein (TIGR02145 family)
MARWIIILIAGILFTCADRTFDNPNDNKVSKESWAPQNFQLEITGNNSVRLTWTQAETRIDGFVLSKKIGDQMDKIYLENNHFSFEDTLANPDFRTSQKVEYFLEAKAGSLISGKKSLDAEFPLTPTLNPDLNYGTVKDIDGYEYYTIQIGNQLWMAENLRVTHYKNGDEIKNGKGSSYQEGLYTIYSNSLKNDLLYGKLYNWAAVMDPRGICPSGWHVPGDMEWTELTDYLGGENLAGEKMKTTYGWNSDGFGTNESGFSGLPGGYLWQFGQFINLGADGNWWSSDEYDAVLAWHRNLNYLNSVAGRFNNDKAFGFSIRCLKD